MLQRLPLPGSPVRSWAGALSLSAWLACWSVPAQGDPPPAGSPPADPSGGPGPGFQLDHHRSLAGVADNAEAGWDSPLDTTDQQSTRAGLVEALPKARGQPRRSRRLMRSPSAHRLEVNKAGSCLPGPCPGARRRPTSALPSSTTTPWSSGGYAVRGYPLLPVRPGTYALGCAPGPSEDDCYPNEKPVTKVRLSQPFWLGEVEVTRSFWNAVLGLGPVEMGDLPQADVTFCDALVFANRLSEQEGLPPAYLHLPSTAQVGEACTWADQVVWDRTSDGYRLPTEAEWAYAAQAGTHLTSVGNRTAELGWDDSQVHPVRGKRPNAWGFYDLNGNVWEWVYDTYRGELPGGQVVDPYVTTSAQPVVASKKRTKPAPRATHFVTSSGGRVVRGGSDRIVNEAQRISNRSEDSPSDSWYYLGFRLARGVPGLGSAP